MTMEELKTTIERWAQPVLEEFGAEIVDMKLHYSGTTLGISILADKLKGGISLEECSRINTFLARTLEAQQVIPNDDFELEVSSPGLDRPLNTKRDFERALHRKIHFYLSGNVDGKKEHVGTVEEATDDKIFIKVKIGVIAIPYPIINKAYYELD